MRGRRDSRRRASEVRTAKTEALTMTSLTKEILEMVPSTQRKTWSAGCPVTMADVGGGETNERLERSGASRTWGSSSKRPGMRSKTARIRARGLMCLGRLLARTTKVDGRMHRKRLAGLVAVVWTRAGWYKGLEDCSGETYQCRAAQPQRLSSA
jgi:hypothetical protein